MRLYDKEIMSIEKPIIELYLHHYKFNIMRTAFDLVINRSTLEVKIKKYGIKNKCTRYAKKGEPIERNYALHKLSRPKIKEMLEKYFEEHGRNQTSTAKALGITRTTLASKLEFYGIIKVKKIGVNTNQFSNKGGKMALWHEEIMKIEKPILEEFLIKHNYNARRACAELGVNRVTFDNKLIAYGIERKPCETRIDDDIVIGNEYRKLTRPKMKEMLLGYYKKNGYIKLHTAKELGISPTMLKVKLEYYGIE